MNINYSYLEKDSSVQMTVGIFKNVINCVVFLNSKFECACVCVGVHVCLYQKIKSIVAPFYSQKVLFIFKKTACFPCKNFATEMT